MLEDLYHHFDPDTGTIHGAKKIERRLKDLRGIFADEAEYERVLETEGNVLVYTVQSIELGSGEGDQHFGIGMIMPGHISYEYFMTKGHLHQWRPASEVYIGLRGQGEMLLQDEKTGESQVLPLLPQSIVYVPGYTAHRTINTGREPLTYMGIYPARAGHDYGSIATDNFNKVIAEYQGHAHVMDREEYLRIREKGEGRRE